MKQRAFAKKFFAVLLAFTLVMTTMFCVGLINVSAEESITTNGNGGKTDVGAWFTTYNTSAFWGNNGRFSDPNKAKVGYKALKADGTFGLPDSASVAEIDFQIKKMAEAGIDFITFDITNGGLSNSFSAGMGDGLKFIVNNAKLTCERLAIWNANHKWKIRYSVAIGTYYNLRKTCKVNPDSTGEAGAYASIGQTIEEQAKAVKEIFVDNSTYGQYYYCIDGKPLLVLHNLNECNPITGFFDHSVIDYGFDYYKSHSGVTTNSDLFSLRPSASVAVKGSYGWYTDGKVSDNNNCGTVVDDEVMLVCPGQANYTKAENPINASREDGAHYQANWDAVIANKPRIVMISSLNDYMEDTAVWPTDTTDCVVEEHWTTDNVEDPYKYWNMTISNIQSLRTANGDTVLNREQRVSNSVIVGQKSVSGNSNMTDGNYAFTTNGYAAVTMSNGLASWDFNFANAETINQVKLYYSNQESAKRPADYAVDVKLPDGTWKRVAERHNVVFDDVRIIDYDLDRNIKVYIPFNFESVSCTAIKITANGKRNANCNNFLLKEIEVLKNDNLTSSDYTGTAADENALYNIAIPTSDNYALGRTVTTNAYCTDTSKLAKITDGNDSSTSVIMYYNTGSSTATNTKSVYLDMSLEKLTKINKVTLTVYLEAASSKFKRDSRDYALDILTEDDIYVRVAEVHNIDFGTAPASGSVFKDVTFTFENIDAKGIRVSANRTQVTTYVDGNNAPVFSPAELKVWNDPNVTTFTGIQPATVTDSGFDYYSSANYALGGTVTTNARTANNGGTLLDATALAKMTDGAVNGINSVLAYFSTANANPYTIYFDVALDKERIINTVDLLAWFEADASTDSGIKRDIHDVAIDVLKSTGEYVRVAERHNIPQNEYPGANTSKTFKFTFEDIKGIGIRVTLNKANESKFLKNGSPLCTITEISVYNKGGYTSYTGIDSTANENAVIPEYTSSNLARNATISSSNTNSNYATSYPVSNLINGVNGRDKGCGIINYNSDGLAWIKLDFDTEVKINKFDLYLSQYEPEKVPQDIAIDALTSNGWVRVAERHGIIYGVKNDNTIANEDQLQTYTFDATTCTAVRIVVSKVRNSSSNFRAVELECYYDPTITSNTGIDDPESPEYILATPADMNLDFNINAVDLSTLVRCLLEIEQNRYSDVNRDGTLNLIDLVKAKKILAAISA